MSLKRGVIALYASQSYAVVVSLAVTPLFLSLLGAEGFGLVGFFMALQAWLQVLDLGLPALLTRQVARWRGGAGSAETARASLRALELLFASIGMVALCALLASTGLLADSWLSVRELPDHTVRTALQAMALACALRWMTTPYRAAIAGAEQLLWLARMGALFTTLRFVAVLPWVVYAPDPIEAFFFAQAALGGVELCLMARRAYALVPPARKLGWHKSFSALAEGGHGLGWAMALATALWFASIQADRVILSKLLSLADFGYFTLAMAAAGAILQVTTPVAQTLVARLNLLKAAGDETALILTYQQATQVICALAACSAAVLAAHAHAVVYVWTGDLKLAAAVAPVLRAFAVAQAALSVVALPYMLQFANGNLRLHLIGTALLLVALVPAVVWGALQSGAVGAGWAWVVVLLAYLLLWIPLVHRFHAPGLHGTWFTQDVLRTVLPAALVAGCTAYLARWWPESRPAQFVGLVSVLVFAGLATLAAAPRLRALVRGGFDSLRPIAQP